MKTKTILLTITAALLISLLAGCFLLPPDITGRWDGTFYFTGSKDFLTGTLDIEQSGTDISGSADIEEEGAWTITGSIDGTDIEFILTSLEITHPLDNDPWIITGTGTLNKAGDRIEGNWVESVGSQTGTFVLER